jgi:hypothetical protein
MSRSVGFDYESVPTPAELAGRVDGLQSAAVQGFWATPPDTISRRS